MLPSKKLLIVDDDAELAVLLQRYLSDHGWDVDCAQCGEEALVAFVRKRPDVVVLDILMPGMDGRAVCRWLRERSQVPILFLTALAGATNLIQGLALGADQYMTKPFSVPELEARLSALYRRASSQTSYDQPQSSPPSAYPDYDDGHLMIDLGRRLVTLDGQQVTLTATEFKILACLVERAGSVVSHQELLGQVWGPEYIGDVAFLKTYIHHLRRKLACHNGAYPYILNKWGVGYRLRAQNERGEPEPVLSEYQAAQA